MIYTFDYLEQAGRLGNQLWQIAAVVSAAKRDGEQALFRPNWRYRPFFNVPSEYFRDKPKTGRRNFRDFGFKYFQEHTLWADMEDEIWEMFQPSSSAAVEVESRVARQISCPNITCAIHVRRGDYLKHANLFPFPGDKYYSDAIELVQARRGKDARFYVFSDDIPWCRKYFPSLNVDADIQYITGISTPVEVRQRGKVPDDQWDMFLMSQCQPAGTMVRTQNGEVPIESLSEGDKVSVYCRDNSNLDLRRISLNYDRKINSITENPYQGYLVDVVTDRTRNQYTPDHICIAKITDAFVNKHVVYLMERDGLFRVGVKSPKRQGSDKFSKNEVDLLADPRARASDEGAENTWVLKTFDSLSEALTLEKFVSSMFCIPEVSFNGSTGSVITPSDLSSFWKEIKPFLSPVECLEYFGRDIRYPLFVRAERRQIMNNQETLVRACNLLDGMRVLDAELYIEAGAEGQVCSAWTPISVDRSRYDGMVYSMDVDINHTYVGNGIVTHNCDEHIIANSSFSWWGAFLSKNKNIIYPSRFWGPEVPEYPDLWKMFPNSWIKLES